MDHSLNKKDKATEADIAYEVLRAQGNPMNYHKLIEEVFRSLGATPEATRVAAVLTQINLDTRFMFLGKGEWGLKAWEPSKVSKRASTVASANKFVDDDEEKTDIDELDEEALDEDISDLDEEVFEDLEGEPAEEKW